MLAVDTWNYPNGQANPCYWEIKGVNFGDAAGSVILGPNPNQVSLVVGTWTKTSIRVYPYADFRSTTANIQFTVATKATPQTPAKRSNIFSDQAVETIKDRGTGQCTNEVARVRMAAGLGIPLSSAYTTNGSIPAVGSFDNNYVPTIYDCLAYGTDHVSIITSTPVSTKNADGSATWTFTVSEWNARWDEDVSRATAKTYKLSKPNAQGNRTVLGGIGTEAKSTWVATGYFC